MIVNPKRQLLNRDAVWEAAIAAEAIRPSGTLGASYYATRLFDADTALETALAAILECPTGEEAITALATALAAYTLAHSAIFDHLDP